jgi:hypothetical protein
METFRISKITDSKTFHKIVCEHFGVSDDYFYFFDDNGDRLDEDDMGLNKGRKVEKVLEATTMRELKDKDLFPPGPRRAMLYLGDDKFEEKYKKHMLLKREKVEEEKANINMKNK